jgi:hypothetical protein
MRHCDSAGQWDHDRTSKPVMLCDVRSLFRSTNGAGMVANTIQDTLCVKKPIRIHHLAFYSRFKNVSPFWDCLGELKRKGSLCEKTTNRSYLFQLLSPLCQHFCLVCENSLSLCNFKKIYF